MTPPGRVLYLVVCAAGPAGEVGRLVSLARGRGWDVYVIPTVAAREHFLDVDALEALSGRPVRITYKGPSGVDRLPAGAVVVAPATYNTINKWAAGICDTYPLTLLAELTGLGVPIAVLPFVNSAMAANRVFSRSIDELRAAGVRVLYGPGGVEPHPPGSGGSHVASFPWHLALDAVAAILIGNESPKLP